MIRYLPVLFTLLLPLSCGHREDPHQQKFHHNHTVFGIHKMNPHATLFAYESEELASLGNQDFSQRYHSLNGEWKFHWSASPRERIKNFYEVDLDDSNWKSIPVPANWEVEGYGHPIYLDERYPFNTNWPDAPEDYNPVGSYRRPCTSTSTAVLLAIHRVPKHPPSLISPPLLRPVKTLSPFKCTGGATPVTWRARICCA